MRLNWSNEDYINAANEVMKDYYNMQLNTFQTEAKFKELTGKMQSFDTIKRHWEKINKPTIKNIARI
ncbi:hypothetical protein [Clostridium sp.]|jgi:hypothetical protein